MKPALTWRRVDCKNSAFVALLLLFVCCFWRGSTGGGRSKDRRVKKREKIRSNRRPRKYQQVKIIESSHFEKVN